MHCLVRVTHGCKNVMPPPTASTLAAQPGPRTDRAERVKDSAAAELDTVKARHLKRPNRNKNNRTMDRRDCMRTENSNRPKSARRSASFGTNVALFLQKIMAHSVAAA